MPLERIAMVCSDGIGDCIAAIPTLRALRRIYPGAQVTVIAHPYSAGVFSRIAGVDEVLPLHPAFMNKARYYAELLALRRRRYTIWLDLLRTSRSFTQTLLIGASRRIGFRRKAWQAFAYTDLLPPNTRHDKRMALHYAETLKPLNASLEEQDWQFSLELTEEDRGRARELLQSRGVAAGQPYAILQATFTHHGRHPFQEWPMDRFSEIARRLSDELGFKVVITSRSEFEAPVQELMRLSHSRIVNLAGATPIPVLAAVIEGASVYVGHNTGPMHIASLVGTPIAAFFEIPNDMVEWKPWTGVPLRQIRSGARCAGCQCGSPDRDWCLRTVPADVVFEAVRDLLQPAPLETVEASNAATEAWKTSSTMMASRH